MRADQKGGLGCLGLIVLFLVLLIATPDSSEKTSGLPELKENVSAEELEEKIKGFHCLSSWDGNHSGLERLVRQELNDPSSLEVLVTRIAPVEEGKHQIIMEFTAKNVFGGRVRHKAMGLVNHHTCDAVLVNIE